MTSVFENRVVKPVRVFTPQMTIDGLLNISLGGRTLDELNLSGRAFLTLSSPAVTGGDLHFEEGSAVLNKASILFVVELPDLGATLGKTEPDPEMHRFARAALRLRIGAYTIEGYVYTTPGSDPLGRLNQPGHPFLAMNAATVSGPGVDFATQFVAVNRLHILVAQETMSISAVPEEVAATSGDVTP